MREVSFQQWLTRQLRLREWSGADFARRLKTHPSTVSYWLRGERVPGSQFCERIADALDLDVETVLAAAGHYRAPDSVDPDSIEGRLISMVKTVHWDDERAALVEGIFRQFRESDRKKRNS